MPRFANTRMTREGHLLSISADPRQACANGSPSHHAMGVVCSAERSSLYVTQITISARLVMDWQFYIDQYAPVKSDQTLVRALEIPQPPLNISNQ